MKKILYIVMLAAVGMFTSCGEDFLVKENLFEVSDATYYSNPEQIAAALTAAYACVPNDGGNVNPRLLANLRSDDCFGGGGANDNGFHDIDAFWNRTENQYEPIWETSYQGILRANMIINRMPENAEYDNEEDFNRDLGEAYFLRAYFHFQLGQLFGYPPLITSSEPVNLPNATPDELYGQILLDFKTAIELLPSAKFQSNPKERLGHATKWAAEGFLARAYLFYVGKFEKSETVTLADGSSLSKADVLNHLEDLIANSGHDLLPDFRNQWPYSYNQDYKYTADNGLEWVGEEGDNIETIFAIHYSPFGGWNAPNKLSYSNQLSLYMNIRAINVVYTDFGQGWGGGPINPQLFNSFEEGDLRKAGSIIDVTDSNEGAIADEYIWNEDATMHETGLWQKKYVSIRVQGTGLYDHILGAGTQSNFQLWNMQNEVILRYADVLLMAAELGSANAQAYLDNVRSRAGLASVPVSLEAIKAERRHELAVEGIRYYDLLRWHDDEAAFAAVKDVPVQNVGADETYTSTYKADRCFLPIPESQILLSEGTLEQNAGWLN